MEGKEVYKTQIEPFFIANHNMIYRFNLIKKYFLYLTNSKSIRIMNLKLVFATILYIVAVPFLTAQEQHTINGKTYSLTTQTQGDLTLLWTTENGAYIYFIKKDASYYPLTNTKQNGTYKQEYKETLRQLTQGSNLSVDKVNLTLSGLSKFVTAYNGLQTGDVSPESPQLGLRLGFFAGITNAVFTSNPTNQIQPLIGTEVELVDDVKLKRHSMVLQFRQSFESGDYKYNASQFSLNYRFKFIKKEKIDVFINTRFATFTVSSLTTSVINEDLSISTVKNSGSDFQAVALFGLGLDYAIGNGFITFGYNDIAGIGVDSNGEFPMDFTVGYKFNL